MLGLMSRIIDAVVDKYILPHRWKGSFKDKITLYVNGKAVFVYDCVKQDYTFKDNLRYRTAELWLKLHMWIYRGIIK